MATVTEQNSSQSPCQGLLANNIRATLRPLPQHNIGFYIQSNNSAVNNYEQSNLAINSPDILILPPGADAHRTAAGCAALFTTAVNGTQGAGLHPNLIDTYFYQEDSIFRHSPGVSIIYCLAYLLVFVIGIFGNSFVVAVVYRSPRMRNVTNYFIVNLAFADILVLVFCLPATLMANIFVPWVFGRLMCKMVPYLQGASVSASVSTLVAISLDRFLAICYPLKCQVTTRRARCLMLLIWVVALVIPLPWAYYFDLHALPDHFPDMHTCTEQWPNRYSGNLYFLTANFFLCYLFPLTLISYCYIQIWLKVWTRNIPGETKGDHMDQMMSRSKVKVVKMLVVVVVIFMLSWLPLYVIFIRMKMGGEIEIGSWEDEYLPIVTPVAQWLGSSNSCVNPVLYAFFNKKFRRGFSAILKSKRCCGTIRYEWRDKSTIISSTTRSCKTDVYSYRSSWKDVTVKQHQNGNGHILYTSPT